MNFTPRKHILRCLLLCETLFTSSEAVALGNDNDKPTLYLNCLVPLVSYGELGAALADTFIVRTKDVCCIVCLVCLFVLLLKWIYPQLSTPITLQHRQQHGIPGLNVLHLSMLRKCILVRLNLLKFPLPVACHLQFWSPILFGR